MKRQSRETREESGIEARPDGFFRDRVEYWYVEEGERIKKLVTFFIAEVQSDSAKIKISIEHSGYELDWTARLCDEEALVRRPEGAAFESKRISRETRYDAMQKLNKEYAALPSGSRGEWTLSRRLVPGEGPLNPEVMFVGQAPGRQEDSRKGPLSESAESFSTAC